MGVREIWCKYNDKNSGYVKSRYFLASLIIVNCLKKKTVSLCQ